MTTCNICGKEFESQGAHAECPSCGAVMENPVPVQEIKVSNEIRDPVAMFVWELLRKFPNGMLEDALSGGFVQLKLAGGTFRADDPFLAAHCNLIARRLRSLDGRK